MPLSKVARKMLLVESSLSIFERNMKKRQWVHDFNVERNNLGEFYQLYSDARHHPEKFYEYLRMRMNTLDTLLIKLDSHLCGIGTKYRETVSSEQRLVLMVRYLATGESFRSLALHFRMGVSTVSKIIKQTCITIWNVLQPEYLPTPTDDQWRNIAEKYWKKWNFPNCVGALDGKHIEVRCPANSGSLYYNYKQYFSILLQALVDADCKLIAVNIGAAGRQSDGGNFRSSTLFKLLKKGELNIPSSAELPETQVKVPFVMVADEAYPLLSYLMRPYPKKNLDGQKRIYNYRLSRARRSVECAFGILSSKWRILLKTIEIDVSYAINIVKAICILHNIVQHYEPSNTDDNESSVCNEKLRSLRPTQHRFTENAKTVREMFLKFFVCAEFVYDRE